jgi:hypothetical protein
MGVRVVVMNHYERFAQVYRLIEALHGRGQVSDLEITRAFKRYLNVMGLEAA